MRRSYRSNKPGAVAFYAGLALLAAALIVSLVWAAIPGIPVMLLGIGLVVRGLTATTRRAAGAKCGACGRSIVFEHEGDFCPRCGAPIHAACAARHAAETHAPEPDGPYR